MEILKAADTPIHAKNPSRKSHVLKTIFFFAIREWDVATSWQLRGPRDNYGMYVAVTVS